MLARLFTFALWGLAAASVVFWGMRLSASPLPVPPQAAPVTAQLGSQAAVQRMLGAAPEGAGATAAPPPESARFKLVGVMAPREGAEGPGVALVSVDGKPARAVALGGVVEGEIVLRGLTHRSASFGRPEGAVAFTLELPELPPARTGTLPAAEAPGAGSAATGAPPAPAATPGAVPGAVPGTVAPQPVPARPPRYGEPPAPGGSPQTPQ